MAGITKDPEVVETVLEDGAVLLNLKTGFYYSLNNVGYRIWQIIDDAKNLDDILDKLMAEYQGEDGIIRSSVPNFLEELKQEALVIPQDDDGVVRISQASTSEVKHSAGQKTFTEPELIKHDEPLHEVVQNPFDPQLPLAE